MKIEILRSPVFDEKINAVREKVCSYILDKDYNLKELKAEELVQWRGTLPNGPFEIFPNNLCPNELINIISDFIKLEFE